MPTRSTYVARPASTSCRGCYDHDRDLHARYVRGISERGDVSREYRRWVRDAVARAKAR